MNGVRPLGTRRSRQYLVLLSLFVTGCTSDRGDPESETSAQTGYVEVPITIVECTNSAAIPGSIIHVNLEICGLIESRHRVQFELELAEYNRRIAEAAVGVVRAADQTDLTDSDLSAIKAEIHQRIVRITGARTVKEIIIPSISSFRSETDCSADAVR